MSRAKHSILPWQAPCWRWLEFMQCAARAVTSVLESAASKYATSIALWLDTVSAHRSQSHGSISDLKTVPNLLMIHRVRLQFLQQSIETEICSSCRCHLRHHLRMLTGCTACCACVHCREQSIDVHVRCRSLQLSYTANCSRHVLA